MQDTQYVAPELKLVGEAAEVVLGFVGSGSDYEGSENPFDMEFEAD